MKHFTKIDEGINVSGILAELEAHPELWDEHTYRKYGPGTPHGEMSDVWVRGNDMAPFESGERPWKEYSDEFYAVWYPAWDKLPSLKPFIWDLMRKVEGESIGIILITKIPPGKRIYPHTDKGWHVEYHEKFYLSLKSEPGAVFWVDHNGVREEISPKPGEVWLTDNRKLHGVENNSDTDRITVIICIHTEKFGHLPLEKI